MVETNTEHPQKLYTVKETATRHGMSVPFWRREIQLKHIDIIKVGKAVRITDEAVEKFFASYSTSVESS